MSALRTAGIRSVFGYGYPLFDPGARSPAEVRRIHAEHFTDDRQLVTMALAPHGPSYSPIEIVAEDWRLARELGLRITTHVGSGPIAHEPIDILRQHGLLTDNATYVHGNSLSDKELQLIAKSGGAVSIAPGIEAQMGHGAPMIGRLRKAEVTTGLGVDAVTTGAGDMFSLMRAALLTGRPGTTAAEILRMATLGGATALGLADRIGSLGIGKQADVLLLRTDSINLLGATHDPVGVVVTTAHPGNVDTVLVAGQVVKRHGRLVHSDLNDLGVAASRVAAYLTGVR